MLLTPETCVAAQKDLGYVDAAVLQAKIDALSSLLNLLLRHTACIN